MAKSKYIEFSTLSVPDFSRSPVGTEAKFLLTTVLNARQAVSSSLTSACVKNGSECQISGKSILIEQSDGNWSPSSILTVVITNRV
jgi:hypothetical protein